MERAVELTDRTSVHSSCSQDKTQHFGTFDHRFANYLYRLAIAIFSPNDVLSLVALGCVYEIRGHWQTHQAQTFTYQKAVGHPPPSTLSRRTTLAPNDRHRGSVNVSAFKTPCSDRSARTADPSYSSDKTLGLVLLHNERTPLPPLLRRLPSRNSRYLTYHPTSLLIKKLNALARAPRIRKKLVASTAFALCTKPREGASQTSVR